MLPTIPYPELVIAICSPIGTNNERIMELVTEALSGFGYQTHKIKATGLMRRIKLKGLEIDEHDVGTRYDTSIKYANKLRDLFGMQYLLAILCVAAIRAYRRNENGKSDATLNKTAFLIDQLKRPEEIEAFRQIYGPSFIPISIFSRKDKRLQALIHRFTRDRSHAKQEEVDRRDAENLIERDAEEKIVPSGQRLRDAFALADVFLDSDTFDNAESQINRFFYALFGSNRMSPTKSEYGMYLARNASFRSLDLSRQVGAAIMTKSGEVVSLGSNEVPKAGGGTYWCDDPSHLDGRDYTRGFDENEHIKRGILADLLRRMAEGGFISFKEKTDSTIDEFVSRVIASSQEKGSIIRDSLAMDILEFGRVIHAEMSAITDAARLGRSTGDASLFCTTFPCHICAKHIVAAGIRQVFFIEPYPKSYAEQLHEDSIVVDVDAEKHPTKVVFSPFIGISPRRYQDAFRRTGRKDVSGNFKEWVVGEARPQVAMTSSSYTGDELAFIKLFQEEALKLVAKGLIEIEGMEVEQ